MIKGSVNYYNVAILSEGELLKGKNILVTGGGSGYGFEIARQLIRQGARVIITGRNVDRLKEAVESLGKEKVFTLQWDFNNVDIATEKIKEAEQLVGGCIYAFVNNAGITKLKNHFTEEDWDDIMSTNTYSLNSVMNYEYDYLRKMNGGKIINITSNACKISVFHPYYVSKTEAMAITEQKAKNSFADKILINSVAPGVAITNINPNLKALLGNSGNVYYSGSKNKRYTLVEDVANTVIFLIMPQGDCINGQNIIVDGGMSLS
jgi:NAD(P)-dependent dehydrogenase (short-subunit alcohol dehydrogenase family)